MIEEQKMKPWFRSPFEWVQVILMIIGLFAVYGYTKRLWPESLHQIESIIDFTWTILAVGFSAWHLFIQPFYVGYRNSARAKTKFGSDSAESRD